MHEITAHNATSAARAHTLRSRHAQHQADAVDQAARMHRLSGENRGNIADAVACLTAERLFTDEAAHHGRMLVVNWLRSNLVEVD